MATKKAFGPDRDLIVGIIQLANLLTRRLAPVFEKAGITPQQWAVISALASTDEPASLAGLARKMLVSKQNMTGMVARLEQLGLAGREDDPNDLRSSRVSLTRRGKQAYERLLQAYQSWRGALSAEIPERDLATVSRSIERLIVHLGD
ncbi:MAG TPA: MarR family transcriptional regulator [Thermoanaerobaculia bacterium]|nr:MarR family transcriptional regulator [Thermoanaerobaculia bacterium]